MKIGIVGANGFVGTRLVEHLALTGVADARAIVRRYSALASVSRFQIEWKIADALSEEQLTQSFEGCDCIVHSIMGDDRAISRCAEPTYRAAQSAGVKRIVFISSAVVYGANALPDANEDTPIQRDGLSSYALAKWQAEQELLALARKGEVEVVILRPDIVFGPRSAWIVEIARQLLEGSAYLVNGGKGICNTIYVDNLIHAILKACEVERASGRIFLVSDVENVTWESYYLHLANLLGASPERIHHVSPTAAPKPNFQHKLYGLKNIPTLQKCFDLIPKPVKGAVRGAVESHYQTEPATLFWESTASPQASPVLSQLHQNAWRMSCEQARANLEFRPPITFEEGMHRSVAWLRFAGLIV